MNKLFLAIAIFFVTFFYPSYAFAEPTASPSPKSSYELFYPIVAGSVPGEPIYFLKTLREWFVGNMIFDQIKASDYHLALSKKRIVEGEKLINNKATDSLIKNTLLRGYQEFQNAITSANKARSGGKSTKDIFNTLKNDGNTISDFLQNLSQNSQSPLKDEILNESQKLKDAANSI